MELNKHAEAKPNFAGLTSQVQQAEMKVILAGKWPPLKPLPVFKYGTDEYRAEIYFDRTRGEWICRKTCLPSNKVQELRGGLSEMTMALPHGRAEGFTEAGPAEQHEQESENEANRRLQAILDWRKNYENGAFYSELQGYLSESQRDEIHDCIRMSHTAWQLQFNPKNIAFVFDALCNAGGRLATLIETAQRNKAEHETDAQAQTVAATREAKVRRGDDRPLEIGPRQPRRIFSEPPTYDEEAAERCAKIFPSESTYARHRIPLDEIKPMQDQDPVPVPTESGSTMSGSAAEVSIGDVPESQEDSLTPQHAKNFVPQPIETFLPELSERSTTESVESILPATLEDFSTEPIGSVSLDEVQTSPAELSARPATLASRVVAREILGASLVSLVAGPREKKQYHTPVAGFGPQVRTDKIESSADHIGDSASQPRGTDISTRRKFGLRLGALAFLAIGFTVGFTVGLNTPAVPPETEESHSLSQSAQPPKALPDDSATPMGPTEPSSSVTGRSDPSSSLDGSGSTYELNRATGSEEISKESTEHSGSLGKSPSADSSAPTIESRPSANPAASPAPDGSNGLIARNSPPPSRREPAHSIKAVDQLRAAPRRTALRRVTLATLRPSPLSVILVTPPGEGGKSLRLAFPEKPIAASSSFAITSQLSVLVSPEPGPAVAHKPARLQAGELVSYVWPRYPRARHRHGSSETVKVRATIGEHGEMLNVKRVSGSSSLLPDAISAIRQWRYKPTLLDKRPVRAQLDVTIEFVAPQYLSYVSTPGAPQN